MDGRINDGNVIRRSVRQWKNTDAAELRERNPVIPGDFDFTGDWPSYLRAAETKAKDIVNETERSENEEVSARKQRILNSHKYRDELVPTIINLPQAERSTDPEYCRALAQAFLELPEEPR